MQIKKILLIIMAILLITGCTKKENSVTSEDITPLVTDTSKFKTEYEEGNNGIIVNVSDDDKIKYVTPSEVLNILTFGTGIIYFGRPTCPWCRNVVPVLLEVARTNNLTVNYLNPGEITGDDVKDYVKVKEALDSYLDYDEDGTKSLHIPDVYFVYNGKILGHHLSTVSSQDDPYTALTSSQKQELINIYNSYIEQMKG